jgi:hypothetical protein
VDPVGSGWRPVAGSCEYGDEPSGSGATELVRWLCGKARCHCKKISFWAKQMH